MGGDMDPYEQEEADLAALRRAAERNYEELAKTGLSDEEQMRRALALGRWRQLAPYSMVTGFFALFALLLFGATFLENSGFESNLRAWRGYPLVVFAVLTSVTAWLCRFYVPGSGNRVRSGLHEGIRRGVRRGVD